MKTFLFIVKHKVGSFSGFNEYIENIELINIDAKSELDAETYLALERSEDSLSDPEVICLNNLDTYEVVSIMMEYTKFHTDHELKDLKIILKPEGAEAA